MGDMSKSVMPVVGNLAWVPTPAVDEVDILDRFNGVPTFGIVHGSTGSHLFWRSFGYVTDHVSLWLYVPLTPQDEQSLSSCDGEDALVGLVNGSPVNRYVTVGAAWDNRLIFEREWLLPAGLSEAAFRKSSLRFVAEAMQMKVDQGLPSSRREVLRAASVAVKELALC
jgi:hypothetical protein